MAKVWNMYVSNVIGAGIVWFLGVGVASKGAIIWASGGVLEVLSRTVIMGRVRYTKRTLWISCSLSIA